MKKAISVLAQFLLFLLYLATFFAGSLLYAFHLDPFHMRWFVTHPTPASTRFFVPAGLILATILFVLTLLLEAARGRLRRSGVWTTLVFLLAVGIGFALKFGFIETLH